MRIEDAKIGMEVENKLGRKFKISSIKEERFRFEGYIPYVLPDEYKPVNPVNYLIIGDSVLYGEFKQKAEIFGKKETGENSVKGKYVFALDLGRGEHTLAFSDDLSMLKEADELEEDDRFIGVDGIKYIVCGREYSDNDKAMVYLAKAVPSGNIYLIDEFGVEEIKY